MKEIGESKPEIRVVEPYIVRNGTDSTTTTIDHVNYEDLDAPAVMRRGRRDNGGVAVAVNMDALDIPAFLRKQAD